MIHGFRFTALGCTGHIRIAHVEAAMAAHAVAETVRWLRAIELRLSRFRSDSLIGRMNAGETVPADEDLTEVLAIAERAHRLTNGRYDATALPLWRLWHDPTRTAWPSAVELVEAQALIAWEDVERSSAGMRLRRAGMALDLGGVGKELCVDRLVERLVACGCPDVLVELGGDCTARGHQPGRDGWLVLLPGVAAALVLRDEGIATSGGGTRRRILAGRVVSHLIDARSGHPASGVVRSATVVAGDCVSAGIHASDLCLLDEVTSERIAERSGGHATFVRSCDGTWFADPRLLTRFHPVAGEQYAQPVEPQRVPA